MMGYLLWCKEQIKGSTENLGEFLQSLQIGNKLSRMDYLLLGNAGLALGAYALYCCRGYLADLHITIIVFIRKKIPYRARSKLARLALSNFLVLFTYYRLSRTLLYLGCHKFRMIFISSKIRKHTLIIDSREGPMQLQLPGDIMLLILQRLQIQDYLRCRAVCRPWRATIDMEIASKQCSSSLAPQLPWLMLSPHLFSAEDHCLFNLSEWRTYYSSSYHSNMNRLDCVGSIEGWLFMVDSALRRPEGFMKPWSFYLHDHHSFDTAYFLLNPITGARVALPSTPFSTFPCGCKNGPGFDLVKLTASSTPTSSSQQQHYCFFVASLCFLGHVCICRPTDRSWTCIKPSIHGRVRYEDIEIMDGKLYGATTSDFVVMFDIQFHDVNGSGAPITYRAERVVTFGPWPICSVSSSFTRTRVGSLNWTIDGDVSYLAKDSTTNELFMITHLVHSCHDLYPTIPWEVIAGGYATTTVPYKTQRFRVFKLKRDPHPHWVKVFGLGDQILFVSRSGCKLIPATSDALNYNPNGLQEQRLERNSIYFAFDNFCLGSPSSGHEFGMYSFTKGSLEFFPWPFLKNSSSRVQFHSRPVWFTPSL